MSAEHEIDETLEASSGGEIPRRVLRRLVPLFRPHGRTLLVASILLLASTAAQLAGPLLIRRAIDVDIGGGSFRGLLLTVALFVVVQLAALGLSYVQKVRLEMMGQEIILGLRRRLFKSLMGQSLSFFDRNPPGRLISRLQGDTDALRQMFASTAVTLLEAAFLFSGMLLVMASVSGGLALIVAGILPFMVAVAWLLASKGEVRFREVRRRAAEISAFLAERIPGIPVIQAFGRETASAAEMEALNREKYRSGVRAELIAIGLFHAIFYLEALGLVLVLWVGGRWAIAGSLSLGTLFMFIEYLRRLFDPVARLSEQIDVMQRAVAAARRVLGLLDLQPGVTDPAAPVPAGPFRREIEFRNVWFSYRGDGEYALRDVSFRIPHGETWAIVGATGGGKTSILNLLLRFYDPQRGEILLDGVDIRSLSQRDLRRRMALVLQDVYLFPGDIESNIAAADGSAPRAREAARVVGADRFIGLLPGGWSTCLAERGGNLSAGERQLLSFARALAADPEILILDEATAAVDPESEAQIQRAMGTLLSGRTAIVIAHRLSTVRNADGILVVRNGRIVERGRHDDLLRLGGVYADLHALQFQSAPGRARAAGGGS